MKKRLTIWGYPLVIIGVLLMLTGSCKKKVNEQPIITYTIGQSYGGGIIFYIDGTGKHGLIAATSDQSFGIHWGCYGNSILGISTTIGSGQANTTLIINGCGDADIAARLCDDLVLNGYSDWFLPSKDELNQMYAQRTVIGNLEYHSYWSSSEESVNYAWFQYFNGSNQYNDPKNTNYFVRAVRAF